MGRRLRCRLAGDRRGVTAIEFGIVAPVMIALLMMLGELLYQSYAQALLDGAIQKGGRDSAIQGGADKAATIDAEVARTVKIIAKNATWVAQRLNYNSFAVIKPETFVDKNGNGVRDPKECFDDVNGNKTWDSDPSRVGQGGANDVTQYAVTVTYPRLFPVASFFGAGTTQTIGAKTLLKNQPYSRQTSTVVQICPT